MPFAGLGLHILLALFCAAHVVRSGQQLYWLIILFSFPLLGSAVYFFVIYLPNSRLERSAFKAVSAAARAMDPTKDLRQAQADFEHTPTAQNQMRLAQALLDVGDAPEAAKQYEACLKGPFASDPDIRIGAARAFVECQRYADAATAARMQSQIDKITSRWNRMNRELNEPVLRRLQAAQTMVSKAA